MILAITGTPGTGKTAVAKILAERMGANLISINKLLNEIKSGWDRKRKTKIVDEEDVKKAVKKHVIPGKTNIVEGHLSHLVDSSIIVVLRCNPEELEKRLKRKKWSTEKIKENVQAEILDEISVESGKKAYEIDTGGRKPFYAAKLIEKLVKNPKEYKHLRVGNIDWSEKYREYLRD